jgi:hypothetical protein
MVRYNDVRINVLKGLEHFIQELGHLLSYNSENGGDCGGGSGWKVVLELISVVPLSMTDEITQNEWINKSQQARVNQDEGETAPITPPSADISAALNANDSDLTAMSASVNVLFLLPQIQWPKECLKDAFSCISLIVDEFLEYILIDLTLSQALLESLSLFGSQTNDINISLTAVEMLWKVGDSALKLATSNTTTANPGKHPLDPLPLSFCWRN